MSEKVVRGKPMIWSNEQIEHWRLIQQAYEADTPSLTTDSVLDKQRQHVQQEMLNLLNAFLERGLSVQEFNTIFQKKINGAWNVFHLKGMSGGMFLNKLMKYIPDQDHFTQLLRVILRLPKQEQ